MDIPLKRCSICGHEKPATAEFFKQRHSRPGLDSWCLVCCREKRRGFEQALRMEVLNHYSPAYPPRCACCGENHPEFLQLDHIEGGGNAHRRQVLDQPSHLFRWLKKNGYPVGFQVLCSNCNFAKGHYGYCPHEKEPHLTSFSSGS